MPPHNKIQILRSRGGREGVKKGGGGGREVKSNTIYSSIKLGNFK